MNTVEKQISAQDIFGQVEPDEQLEPHEARRLRKQRASAFAAEAEHLIRTFPDKNSRKGKKQTTPLKINLDGTMMEIKAVKETSPWINFGRIHYISTNYKLIITNPNQIQREYSLFSFEEFRFPKRDNPTLYEHGDTKISNHKGRMATHHEALEALWGVRFLGEQLAGKIEAEKIGFTK